MQLKTLILIIVGPLVIAGVLGVVLLKQKKELLIIQQQQAKEKEEKERQLAEEQKAKRQQMEEEHKKKVPMDLLRKGERAEGYGKWKDAVEFYKGSLEFMETEETKRKLRAVTLAMEAEKLEQQEKWDDALAAFEQARTDSTNKTLIDEQIEHIKGIKAYGIAMAKGDERLAAGNKQEAIEAYDIALELATKHHLKTDVDRRLRELREKVEQKAASKADLFDLIEKWSIQKELFALLALYNHCVNSPEYAETQKKLKEQKHHIEQAIKATPGSASGMRAVGDRQNITLVLADGSEVAGELLEETKSAYKVNVTNDDGSVLKRLILRSGVKSTRKPTNAELNNGIAETLFISAVREYTGKDYFKALKLIGQIQYEFADSAILANPDQQKALMARQSIALLEETGGTLDGMVGKAVGFCQEMCFTCGGTGGVRCTKCNGTGKLRHPCNLCIGKGNRPCDSCMGTGKRDKNKCGECKGKGTQSCELCAGKGYLERTCDECAKRECPFCRGRKRKPTGPCRACNGAGRTGVGGELSCQKCGGTGLVVSNEPCPACTGTGVVGLRRCSDCGGTGRGKDGK